MHLTVDLRQVNEKNVNFMIYDFDIFVTCSNQERGNRINGNAYSYIHTYINVPVSQGKASKRLFVVQYNSCSC